jgi:pyruvate,orthophosphate dikinase
MREVVAPIKADATATYVHDIADVDFDDARSFGGKATGLAKMARIGIPIPPAFVVGTNGFHHFRSQGGRVDADLMGEVDGALRRLENLSGKTFAGAEQPLLVSVRSGAAISMPGMMDTILNLGLDARSAHQLAQTTGKPEFAIDTWMRFWRMFTDTVLNLDPDELTASVAECAGRVRSAVTRDAFDALENAILTHIADSGEEASSDPHVQLERTIEAVFRSWDSARAKAYRAHHGIADDLGTAVTVQAMVFGNADARSGSGVAFTRNPNDGENSLYGEYLVGRQGEDLVSGTYTPIDLSDPQALEKPLRDALIRYGKKLEKLYRDAVDIEFTVEAGELYLLQVRPAKRTAAA